MHGSNENVDDWNVIVWACSVIVGSALLSHVQGGREVILTIQGGYDNLPPTHINYVRDCIPMVCIQYAIYVRVIYLAWGAKQTWLEIGHTKPCVLLT